MVEFLERLFELLRSSGIDFAVLASVVASLLGAALSLLQSQQRLKRRLPSAEDKARQKDQLEIQIGQIKEYLEQQETKELISRWSNYLLNFSQYAVGAALTTSFIADNLTGKILGVLGVVTLLSAFAQQLLRPDIKRLAAARRVVRLREILRRAEISAAEVLLNHSDTLVLQTASRYLEELHQVQRDEWDEWRKDNKDF